MINDLVIYILTFKVRYYYRVRSAKAAGGKTVYGKWGAVVKASTNSLPRPDDITVVSDTAALKFTWSNTNNMAAIQIYYATANSRKTKWKVLSINERDFDLTNLARNKTYYCKYRYVYFNGSTSYSKFSTVKTIKTN